MDTTFEEAKRCPKCEQPGQETGRISVKDTSVLPGTKVATIRCDNSRCKWQGESWIVQVNPDGTIPPAKTTGREKRYESRGTPESGRRLVDGLRRQVEREVLPGATVTK